ncbi:MAG: hypothetical protein VKJ06_02860 [Vampirovibrionales bacterium]|nr:hypothetical protein [Vampirovibrionales bacterium]
MNALNRSYLPIINSTIPAKRLGFFFKPGAEVSEKERVELLKAFQEAFKDYSKLSFDLTAYGPRVNKSIYSSVGGGKEVKLITSGNIILPAKEIADFKKLASSNKFTVTPLPIRNDSIIAFA